jgi:hypothetical protein
VCYRLIDVCGVEYWPGTYWGSSAMAREDWDRDRDQRFGGTATTAGSSDRISALYSRSPGLCRGLAVARDDKPICTLITTVRNQHGVACLSGSANTYTAALRYGLAARNDETWMGLMRPKGHFSYHISPTSPIGLIGSLALDPENRSSNQGSRALPRFLLPFFLHRFRSRWDQGRSGFA